MRPLFVRATLWVALLVVHALTARAAAAQSPPPPPPDEVPAPAPAEGQEPAALARVQQLLRFVSEAPEDPRAADALAEARRLLAQHSSVVGDGRVDAVLAIFSAEDANERRAKVEALAALADPAFGTVFAYLARNDPDSRVTVSAARALGSVRTPAFEALASALLFDPRLPPAVRAAAASALGDQRSVPASDALVRIARDGDAPAPVRQAAVDVLRESYPERFASLRLSPRVSDASGQVVGTVVGAASGAYTLALVGALSQDTGVGIPVGIVGGGVIGGAGAYLLARSTALNVDDALLLGGAGAWSVPVGWFLGNLTVPVDGSCERPCTAVALGTHVASMTTAWLLRDRLELTMVDHVEVNSAALSGLLTALGANLALSEGVDTRPGMAALAAGTTLGFVGGAAFADRIQLSGPMAGLALLSAAELGFAGTMVGLATRSSDSPSRRVAGLGLLGAGVGLGGMLAASTVWQPTASDVALIGFGALQGNLLGAAVPALLSASDDQDRAYRRANWGTAIGGVAGAVGLGLLTPALDLRLETGDGVLVGLGSGFALWQALGWTLYLNQTGALDEGARSLGTFLGGFGVGSAALLAGSQFLELSAWQAGWLYSGAVWGAWLGYWGAYLGTSNLDPDGRSSRVRLLSSLLGSAGGLGVSAVLLSPLFDLHPSTLAWVSLFGVGGMTVSSMVAVFVAFDLPGKPVATANVIGTVVGLAAGAALAPTLNRVTGAGSIGTAPSRSGGLGAPVFVTAPLFDGEGRGIEGFSAQLLWVL